MSARYVLLIMMTLLLTGCLADSTVLVIEEEPKAGFFYGVFHGFLFYPNLLHLTMGEQVSLYDLIHDNVYDLGFLSGLGLTSAALRLFVLNLPVAYFSSRMNSWVVLFISIVMGVVICGGPTYIFIDSQSVHWTPRAWPEGVDTNDGVIWGMWHAIISPWIALCNLFGYSTSLMSSQSVSYLVPFAIISFFTKGRARDDDDEEEASQEELEDPVEEIERHSDQTIEESEDLTQAPEEDSEEELHQDLAEEFTEDPEESEHENKD